MHKNAYSLEKRLWNCRSARGLRPRIPLVSGEWGLCPQTSALLRC